MKYLIFELIHDSGKTTSWRIIANQSSDLLGFIRWYGPWRRYVFYPNSDTLFDLSCLRDIASKIEQLMNNRRAIAS